MASAAQQVLAKATRSGLVCLVSKDSEHCIQPTAENPHWQLIYQKEAWVLVIKGLPQIRFADEDVMKFLERFGDPSRCSAT